MQCLAQILKVCFSVPAMSPSLGGRLQAPQLCFACAMSGRGLGAAIQAQLSVAFMCIGVFGQESIPADPCRDPATTTTPAATTTLAVLLSAPQANPCAPTTTTTPCPSTTIPTPLADQAFVSGLIKNITAVAAKGLATNSMTAREKAQRENLEKRIAASEKEQRDILEKTIAAGEKERREILHVVADSARDHQQIQDVTALTAKGFGRIAADEADRRRVERLRANLTALRIENVTALATRLAADRAARLAADREEGPAGASKGSSADLLPSTLAGFCVGLCMLCVCLWMGCLLIVRKGKRWKGRGMRRAAADLQEAEEEAIMLDEVGSPIVVTAPPSVLDQAVSPIVIEEAPLIYEMGTPISSGQPRYGFGEYT